jgi:hypothetical protein
MGSIIVRALYRAKSVTRSAEQGKVTGILSEGGKPISRGSFGRMAFLVV